MNGSGDICQVAKLADRGVVEVAGEAARDFLHGIVTNDMRAAREGQALHAGLLSPQGKILFDFFVCPLPDEGGKGTRFLLECARETKDDLVKRLIFYRLRAKVEIADRSADFQVFALWGGEGQPVSSGGVLFADPRLEALGWRLLAGDAEVAPAGCAMREAVDYHRHRIALGVPEGGRDFAFGEVFPHEANFDLLNGVHFTKGCYVGQEVVSRMQHKTVVRKRIIPLVGKSALPPAGTPITVADFPIGVLGSSVGQAGLGLVRLDRAEKALAEGKPLLAAGVEITLKRPQWASFAVPGAAPQPAD